MTPIELKSQEIKAGMFLSNAGLIDRVELYSISRLMAIRVNAAASLNMAALFYWYRYDEILTIHIPTNSIS